MKANGAQLVVARVRLATPRPLLVCCALPFALLRRRLFSFKVITGTMVGIVSVAVPLYIAEISPARLRGTLGSLSQFLVTIGILSVYVIGRYLSWDGRGWEGAILLIELTY